MSFLLSLLAFLFFFKESSSRNLDLFVWLFPALDLSPLRSNKQIREQGLRLLNEPGVASSREEQPEHENRRARVKVEPKFRSRENDFATGTGRASHRRRVRRNVYLVAQDHDLDVLGVAVRGVTRLGAPTAAERGRQEK